MKRTLPIAFALILTACGSDTVDDDGADMNSAQQTDMNDSGSVSDTGARLDMTGGDAASADTGNGSDSGSIDQGTSSDMGAADLGEYDMANGADMANADMANADMASTDMASMDMEIDMGSGGYDTTGWTMKRWTKNESASSGTPDSYFFDVDSGSPLSASIVGGGSGTWSVNVFGGMTNQLHCTGSSSCQIMLNPLDTVVIITAITTDIGSYSLTVDYAGMGPR